MDMNLKGFSEKALQSLNGYYVYALIDPRTDGVFYIGKGIENRVFNHEIEHDKDPESEKRKIQTINAIEKENLHVKRVIINWGLTESEAFAAEASLINLLHYTKKENLSNIVAGHHVHESLTVEEFELQYGAESLTEADIKHPILVIKINKRYHRNISQKDLYDAVRGIWKASISSIKKRKIEYVFGVYNQLIVAVYKPDEWHYVHEMLDVPRPEEITDQNFEKVKDRIYFTCKDFCSLDSHQQFYLHKSIVNLKVNQSSQNPISYLMPKDEVAQPSQIHSFALRWLSRFQDENANFVEFIEPKMGKEMRKLGFEMDSGTSFMSVYDNAIHEETELRKIIHNIDDVSLLGSAIFSKWRYFNHWAYSGAEIFEPENRRWFILALSRLAELTKIKVST